MPPETATVPTPSIELSDRLMPLAEVADVTGVSVRSVRRLVLAGELACVYVTPRAPRILASSLVQFVSRHAFVPKSR